MVAEVKTYFSNQIDVGEIPSDPDDCAVIVTASYGLPDEDATEDFAFINRLVIET